MSQNGILLQVNFQKIIKTAIFCKVNNRALVNKNWTRNQTFLTVRSHNLDSVNAILDRTLRSAEEVVPTAKELISKSGIEIAVGERIVALLKNLSRTSLPLAVAAFWFCLFCLRLGIYQQISPSARNGSYIVSASDTRENMLGVAH